MAATLDVATERLSRAWGAVSHLNSVADTPALRAAYNAALPKVTEFWTRLGADERLYAKYKAMDPATLNAEQARARENALRGFVLGGAELQGAAKARFADMAALRLLAEAAGPPPGGEGLAVSDEHPVARLIAAGSHPDFRRLQRLPSERSGELARNIPIAQVRALQPFFGTTPSLSSRRFISVAPS